MSTVILPVVYIAGPYRAATPRKILAHIWQAQETALAVWRAGGVAICPHSNSALLDGEVDSDDVWLAGGLELLRRSDAIVMVGDWQASSGASAEHRLAVSLGLPIFYDTAPGVLSSWIAEWKRSATVEG